jgi:signal transduction histidine kinase/DNA-binding response OmpR family regulator
VGNVLSMNAPARRNSVRAKLLWATMGLWVLVTLATLGAVAVGQYRTSVTTAHRTERMFRDNQREKGRLLIANQTLALRAMAVDNAISDVRQLVRKTVQEDVDVIYGSFVDAKSIPWIVVTPRTPEVGVEGIEAQARLREIGHDVDRNPAPGPRMRVTNVFGANVDEHASDVFDGSDYLGTIRYGISMARTEAALHQELDWGRRSLLEILAFLALLGIAGIALGVVAIHRIAHHITQPLAELAQASVELGRGNRSVRAHVHSGDELEQLAQTFNAMAESNEKAMVELEVKTAEALESSRLKSEFLANMSHEIRTPMNGILGVVRLVHKMPLEGKLRRYVETIDSSASALLTIINDVLDFSKMEAGKYSLKSVDFDLRTVVQEVCELLSTRAHDKGLELVCRIDPMMHSLHVGDPDRLRQVINNLLGNAIKFTEHGEVFVDLRVVGRDASSETLRLAVLDTGIGIAPQDVGRLFDAFSQVDGSMARKYGGTGLGLAISKRLVEMMGGKIVVKSALGQGSEFSCELRFELAADASNDRGSWADGKHAFVVESHSRWQAVVREHLEAWGMSVACFSRGQDALLDIQEHAASEYDVAVIGTQLVDMPFDELVRRLRAIQGVAKVPIVALYQLGANSFVSDVEKELTAQLPKPLRFSELYNALQQTLIGERMPSGKMLTSGSMPIDGAGRVLVVDDNEINRFVAAEMLEQMGYEVETAENGAEALELIKREEYLAVLMDCQMPVMDGYTATRELREIEKQTGQHQTIIALTAHALSGERERVLDAGMDDYLSKPVRPNSLDRMIRRHARLKRRAADKPVGVQAISGDEPCLDGTISRSKKLIELFLKNVPGQLDAIDETISRGNPTELRAHAHKTKGSCLALGATLMAQSAEKLQKLAETGSLAGASELAKLTREQFQEVECELGRELATG